MTLKVRKPGEVLEGRCDVVTGAGGSQETSSRVLDALENFGCRSLTDVTAVVLCGCYEG